ncbi:hypothetical protein D3C86_1156430 [compost metagenome]
MNKISATFSVWSDNLIDDPMGLFSPDGVVRRGRDRDPPREVPIQNGYHFSREFESIDIEGAIGVLRAGNFLDIVIAAKSNGKDVRFSLSFFSEFADQKSIFLSASSLSWLASIGCDFDVVIADVEGRGGRAR